MEKKEWSTSLDASIGKKGGAGGGGGGGGGGGVTRPSIINGGKGKLMKRRGHSKERYPVFHH